LSEAKDMNPFNHDIPAEDAPEINVHYNGRWIKVPKGLNVVEVAKRQGDFIPHYCYHPKLSISGNCRMCLFEMGMPKAGPDRKPVLGDDGLPVDHNWIPKPQIGCATNVSEGMGIRTDSPLAEECRRGVMEFLLINHPLDCPICDQAGECKLQEFSSDYGTGESRFVEEKVKKPKNVDLGERIVLDDERCILCSRCVRFADEVVDDDVLGFVNRGSYNTLTCHPGRRFDNEYSLNTVDICPVGALTSKDFRFKMRVWFLRETKTICTSCGRGCNILAGSRQNELYRLTPRTNEEVNSHWMCDYGRLNFHYLGDPKRIRTYHHCHGGTCEELSWQAMLPKLATRLNDFKPEEVAVIASARMTNEEAFLLKLWMEEWGVELSDVVPRTWQGDRFLKVEDQNPNSAGVELMGISQKGEAHRKIAEAVRTGKVKCLIALHEDATAIGLTEEDLKNLNCLVACSILPNATTEQAHFLLPGTGFAEKTGTMINVFGRIQKLNQAVQPPCGLMEWEWLRDLRAETGGGNSLHALTDVFKAMAEKHPPLNGLKLSRIGDQGIQLEPSEAWRAESGKSGKGGKGVKVGK
jgi:NADH-quinone oxidoreductase subunit G